MLQAAQGLFAVTVDVAVDEDLLVVSIGNLVHQSLCVVYFRMQLLVRANPLAIKIDSCQAATIIAAHDAIWIQTRDCPEDVVAEQHCALDRITLE